MRDATLSGIFINQILTVLLAVFVLGYGQTQEMLQADMQSPSADTAQFAESAEWVVFAPEFW